jgi:UDP:flavonoid glycosyltransferase YjiC (YdhE family)
LAVATAAGDDRFVATIWHNLGRLAHARGRPSTGERGARDGLRLRERADPDPVALAEDRDALAVGSGCVLGRTVTIRASVRGDLCRREGSTVGEGGAFLVASWDGGGNTPPAFAIAARLGRSGYQVRLLGWPEMARRAAAAGVDFAAYPSVPPWPAGITHEDDWDGLSKRLHGAATRDDIEAEARRFAADVLVVDCMMGSAFDAAQRLGLPLAVLVHPLYRPFAQHWGDVVLPGGGVGDRLGRADLVLALAPKELDEPGPVPKNTHYVGPILRPEAPLLPVEDRMLLDRPGNPWVLISLSTTHQGQGAVLPTLLEAVGSLPVRGLLTLGDVLAPDSVAAPSNVTVWGHVRHDAVLPRMSAVLTHAGMSTITTALAFGVPLVCVPQGREQPVNAARVEAVGAGRSLPRDASAATVGSALTEVIASRSIRKVAARFASMDRGATAVRLAETLLASRQVAPAQRDPAR